MEYHVTEENVKLVGRSFEQGTVRWFALSGSGISFRFRGKKLMLDLVGDNTTQGLKTEGSARIGIYIGTERVVDMMLKEQQKQITVIDGSDTQTVEIRVIKLSEAPMSMFGIAAIETDEEATIAPLPKLLRKIEIIGDSITCGYGVDREDPNTEFTTETEDVTRSYSYKLANKLSADYSMVSYSGYGIISGYTDDDIAKPQQCIPLYYEKMGYSDAAVDGKVQPQNIPWDFDRFKPDVIVINLGTNDDSYCQDVVERQEHFAELYVEFLEMVRRNNPTATILCVVGTMGERIYDFVHAAVVEYRRQFNDLKVYDQRLTEQLPEDGLVSSSHPTERTHEKVAECLAATIRKIMSW